MLGPDPKPIYPINDYDKVIFLKNFVNASNIIIGDYTYFDDHRNGLAKFYRNNITLSK